MNIPSVFPFLCWFFWIMSSCVFLLLFFLAMSEKRRDFPSISFLLRHLSQVNLELESGLGSGSIW